MTSSREVEISVIDVAEPRGAIGLQDVAHAGDVRRLLPEVELALQRLGQMLDHGRDVDEPAETRAALGLLGEQFEQPEVAHDRVARVRPLDLDDDRLAALERGAVHLGDRAGRERDRVDRLEHVLPRHAELLLHHRNDLRLGQRRDLVLERRQLLDELGGEQVRTRREDLPELGERRTELFEGGAQAARALLAAGRPASHAREARTSP